MFLGGAGKGISARTSCRVPTRPTVTCPNTFAASRLSMALLLIRNAAQTTRLAITSGRSIKATQDLFLKVPSSTRGRPCPLTAILIQKTVSFCLLKKVGVSDGRLRYPLTTVSGTSPTISATFSPFLGT